MRTVVWIKGINEASTPNNEDRRLRKEDLQGPVLSVPHAEAVLGRVATRVDLHNGPYRPSLVVLRSR
jgi:hypothetical protein